MQAGPEDVHHLLPLVNRHLLGIPRIGDGLVLVVLKNYVDEMPIWDVFDKEPLD